MNTLTEVFSMLACDILVAHNGKEELEILKSLRTSEYLRCIILDLMMPVMTGSSWIQCLSSFLQLPPAQYE